MALAVKTKFLVAVKLPSVTIKLIFEKPFCKNAGLIVAEQFGAIPLKTIFATGIKVVFEDVATTEVVQLSALSTSLMVKLTTIATSCGVV